MGFLWREGAEDSAEVALPKSERRRGDALPLGGLAIRHLSLGRAPGRGGCLLGVQMRVCGLCGSDRVGG